MCRFSLALAALALSVCALAAPPAATAGKYNIGREPTAAEIAGWDIAVKPDGTGLPPGSGSVAKGEAIYEQKCAVCHGSFGESNDYHILSGGRDTLKTAEPMRSVGSYWEYATALFDYIRRAMPLTAPQTLTADEVYSVTAYVLYLNDILKESATLDRNSLPRIRMPNAGGFTTAHGFMDVKGKPDTHNTACMKDCATEVTVRSELPEHAKAQVAASIPPAKAGRAASPASANAGAAAAFKLAKDNACTGCHDVAHKVVGPAFREVAARYRSDTEAEAKLAAKVKKGGSGNWGEVPMPPQSQLSDSDLKTLIEWVLAGAKTR